MTEFLSGGPGEEIDPEEFDPKQFRTGAREGTSGGGDIASIVDPDEISTIEWPVSPRDHEIRNNMKK